MRQQHAAGSLRDQILGDAAEDQLAEARMTIGARDDQAGAEIAGDLLQLHGGGFASARLPGRAPSR